MFYSKITATYLYIWIVFTNIRSYSSDTDSDSVIKKVHKHGDIMIGGLFSFHSRIAVVDDHLQSGAVTDTCTTFDYKGFRRSQAMIYAIEEINKRTDILPNITLGYDIRDTCSAVSKSLEGAIDFVESLQVDDHHLGDGRTLAVVGASNSATSESVASVMGIFNVPVISYSSTSRLLSNRLLYKSFFRTVPSDAHQAVAMAELVRHFGWEWVGTIAADDSYGRPGIEQFIREAEVRDVCVSFRKLVTSFPTEEEIKDVVSMIVDNPDAKVIVTFLHFAKVKLILEEVSKQDITDRIWIASEAWADNNEVAALDLKVITGTHGIRLTLGEIPGFGDYLEHLNPFKSNILNPFLNELWETSFDCVLPMQSQFSTQNDTRIYDHDTVCSFNYSIKETPSYKPTGLWGTYRTYLAVYAIAAALEDIRTCVEPHGLLLNGSCPKIDQLQPWQLLKYVLEVNFTGTDGRHISFSETGDVSALYHIVNWQESSSQNGVDFVEVGMYDGSAPDGKKLTMNDTNIVWGYKVENDQIPVSVCSQPCSPGTRKGVIPGAPNCCFECVPCLDGEISNVTGASTCTLCPVGFWSNANNTKCKAKSLNYLSWTEAGGLTVVILTSIGILFTIFVTALFIKSSSTPVVKASNRDLSFLLLAFIALCFASVFVYIGIPTNIQCVVQTPLRSCGFTGCVSILLVKTHSVVTIFEAKLPSSLQRKRCVGTRLQIMIVLVLVFVQLLIYVITAVIVPPEVVYNNDISKTVTYVECKDVAVAPTVILVLYTWTIAGACLGFAIRARKLPENFNETKHIMFSMLVYFVVWLTYFPAFLWTYGKYKALAQCVVLIASSYGMLMCVFGPKCLIIIFKPQLNTPAAVRKLTMQHAARRASSAVDAAGGKRSSSVLSSNHHSLDALRVHTPCRNQNKRMKKSSSTVRFSTDVDGDVAPKSMRENLTEYFDGSHGIEVIAGGISNPIDVMADEINETSENSMKPVVSEDQCCQQHPKFCAEEHITNVTNNNGIDTQVGGALNHDECQNTNQTPDSEKNQSFVTSSDNYESENVVSNEDDCHGACQIQIQTLKDDVAENEIVVSNNIPQNRQLLSKPDVVVRRNSFPMDSPGLSSLSTCLSNLGDVGDDDVFLTPFTNQEFFKNFSCNCSFCRRKIKKHSEENMQSSTSRTKSESIQTHIKDTDNVFVTIQANI